MSNVSREFGNLLTKGLKSIHARDDIAIAALEDKLGYEMAVTRAAIEKWRQGHIPPDLKNIAILAKVCVYRGNMDRDWLTRFLNQARFPEKEALIQELFPNETQASPRLRNNLPRRPYERFVGRGEELVKLQRFLSPHHRLGVICLSGIAGIGKTAIALEIAHQCCESNNTLPFDERFDAIVWVSAKQSELLPAGIVSGHPTLTDLDSLYRAIAEVLDLPAITRSVKARDCDIIVARALAEQRVLLVLDNLEDIDDPALMIFLRDLPHPSKAIVTTRHRIDVAIPVQLEAFNEDEARELIRLECQYRNLFLTHEDKEKLLKYTHRVPLAIVRTIGRMEWRGSSVAAELQQLANPANEMYDFCFERSVAAIRGRNAHRLFMALAFFPTHATREVLGDVAGCKGDIQYRDEGLSDLEVLSLVNKERDRFSLEALTKAKAQAELTAYSGFEQEARERWIKWYLNFTNKYGGKDWRGWHTQYAQIDEEWKNLLAVFDWCAVHNRYDEMRSFWQRAGVLEFVDIYGYWRDRLIWLDWLLRMSSEREDWSTVAETISNLVYTLTLTNQLEDADILITRGWNIHEHAPLRVQIYLAQNTALLRIYQKKYKEASSWFHRAEVLLGKAPIDDPEYSRLRTIIEYNRGLMYYWQQNYPKAEGCFQKVIKSSQNIEWERATLYAQNFMAEIAIKLNRLDEAEHMLLTGLTMPACKQDKLRLTCYKSSLAHLYKMRGNLKEACCWAKAAQDGFERLGMKSKAEEMQTICELTDT